MKKHLFIFFISSLSVFFTGASLVLSSGEKLNFCPQNQNSSKEMTMLSNKKLESATFGAGCFWCVEAVFQNLKGVESVVSGYSGGNKSNPTYEEVCTGETGHAEVCRITFDPEVISFSELLEVFWKTHDPTTLNRQGADIGSQYRSVIFYENENQKELAEKYKSELNKSGIFDKPIITQIIKFTEFYPAENYHQDYYNNNSNQPYCTFVITPKLEKFEKIFKDKLK